MLVFLTMPTLYLDGRFAKATKTCKVHWRQLNSKRSLLCWNGLLKVSILKHTKIYTSRYPVEYPRSWKKIFRSGEGKGIRGGKEKKKEKKHRFELPSRVSNLSLKSQIPYPSPTVTLNLQCEQF